MVIRETDGPWEEWDMEAGETEAVRVLSGYWFVQQTDGTIS